jgi:hypothetical protein
MKKEPEFTADQIKDLIALKKNIAASAELKNLRKKFDWLKDYRSALTGDGIEVDGVGKIAYKESLTLMVQ